MQGHAGQCEKQTFKQMIAIQYNCYGRKRCNSRIRNGDKTTVCLDDWGIFHREGT